MSPGRSGGIHRDVWEELPLTDDEPPRSGLSAEQEETFAPGVYLTDGNSLFNIVGELPHEPSLRLIEDCSTLEVLMIHVEGLRSPRVRRVHADSEATIEDSLVPLSAAERR
ncbi:MAG: hypothetical protein ACYCU0_07340 [Solirubrobacteraceae bacterium]